MSSSSQSSSITDTGQSEQAYANFAPNAVCLANLSIHLTFKSVTYKISKRKSHWWSRKKQIVEEIVLNDVSGEILPGEMVAILGPNWSGKTALLRILAGRNIGGKLTGDIRVNNHSRGRCWRQLVGYVPQTPSFIPQLTVKETLQVSATLRLPRNMTVEEKEERVQSLLRNFGLSSVADKKIIESHAGMIEGDSVEAENKRLAIALEMLTYPCMLFMEEPIKYMDTFTAHDIMESLAELCKRETATSVICTMHQPRTDVLSLFSKIILMAQGQIVYIGGIGDALAYFSDLGMECPRLMNPADFFLDQITINYKRRATVEETTRKIHELQLLWREYEEKTVQKGGLIGGHSPAFMTSDKTIQGDICCKQTQEVYRISWFTQFYVLLIRHIRILVRNRQGIYVNAAQGLILAAIIGFVFFRLQDNQTGIQNRIGFLFTVIVNLVFALVLPVVRVNFLQRSLICSERLISMYKLSAFSASKFISVLPDMIIKISIFSGFVYYIVGLNPSASHFFIFWGILLSVGYYSIAIGLFVAALAPNALIADVSAPLLCVLFIVVGGNVANNYSITWILRWIQYLSVVYYGYSALLINEFTGLTFTCDTSPCVPGFTTGDQVLVAYGVTQFSILTCCLVMIGLGLATNILTYFILRFQTRSRCNVI